MRYQVQGVGEKGRASDAEGGQLLAYQAEQHWLIKPFELFKHLHFFLEFKNKMPECFFVVGVWYRQASEFVVCTIHQSFYLI